VPATHVVGVCRCPSCLLQGGGRILESVERAAGTRLPGTSLDGTIRLEAIDCHGDSPAEPYVTLDGAVQSAVTPDGLADAIVALRAAAAPAGRA
jgi:NADH:ubiquinone oxidoreductase subunit E